MATNNNLSGWLYGVGLLMVVATHVYMLLVGLPPEQMTAHALLNLVAACLLAAGWLKGKA